MSNEISTQITPMALTQQLLARPDFTTDMLRDMLNMVHEQNAYEAKRIFQAAFSRCQAQVTKAEKDKPNPLFNSRYATIEAMYDAVWPAAMAHGFSWTVTVLPQAPEGWDNTSMMWFRGKLSLDIHDEFVELPVPKTALVNEGPKGNRAAMTPMQTVGALVTYMRKYLLGMMFGVVTSDDVVNDRDGNGVDHDPPKGKPKFRTTRDQHDKKDDPSQTWLAKYTDLLVEAEQAADGQQFLKVFREACATCPTEKDLVRLLGLYVVDSVLSNPDVGAAYKASMHSASKAAFQRLQDAPQVGPQGAMSTPDVGRQGTMPLPEAALTKEPWDDETGELFPPAEGKTAA